MLDKTGNYWIRDEIRYLARSKLNEDKYDEMWIDDVKIQFHRLQFSMTLPLFKLATGRK